ncbi:MAG: winged helix-turn-helix domain-containing protein [Proteobacteria bacterium]|nr:winged helix-turn-helix domain-containing protein [Pseudomonadota bacterium]
MIYRFNHFELNTQNYQLIKSGNQVAVEPQVFDLLKYLIANRNRLVSREEIFDEIWSGRIVSDTSLSNHIKSARKVIGDNGRSQSCIKTVHGRGYQFIASTDEIINHGSDLASLPVDDSIGRSENRGPLIVVLPFQNMSSDPEQKYFAEGMSEDITTELSRFTDLQVIARHTAFQFTSASLDINKIAEKLSVEYLVEGSVRRTQDRIRINAQLIDASSGNHIWAEKYDRPLDQIFKIQDEITETIVSTISGQIRNIETDRANSRGTDNLSAYDHLLRGLSYHKNGYVSYDNYVKAFEEFTRAIELDPKFARARAWILCAEASMWRPKSDRRINDALEAAKYALKLDEKESETHRILGSLYLYQRNYQLSGHHYHEAMRLSPNDAHIAVKTGRYYAYIDKYDEALRTVERAMRLNPLHPGWYWMELGIVYYSMGEYQKAIDAYYKNWELEAYDLALIAATYIAMNEIDRAEEAAQKALVIEPKSSANLYTQFETYQDKEKHKLLCDRMTAAGIPA